MGPTFPNLVVLKVGKSYGIIAPMDWAWTTNITIKFLRKS
jgi:hypothetical protein